MNECLIKKHKLFEYRRPPSNSPYRLQSWLSVSNLVSVALQRDVTEAGVKKKFNKLNLLYYKHCYLFKTQYSIELLSYRSVFLAVASVEVILLCGLSHRIASRSDEAGVQRARVTSLVDYSSIRTARVKRSRAAPSAQFLYTLYLRTAPDT